MKSLPLPLLGAAALGFAVATVCFALSSARPAGAQFSPPLGIQNQAPVNAQAPQPHIAVEALDADRFVMVTREPRLVQSLVREGAGQNMLLTVVTHYTVKADRLIPVEHVRVPDGYRLVNLSQ
jgi:hypothetical protein